MQGCGAPAAPSCLVQRLWDLWPAGDSPCPSSGPGSRPQSQADSPTHLSICPSMVRTPSQWQSQERDCPLAGEWESSWGTQSFGLVLGLLPPAEAFSEPGPFVQPSPPHE